MAHMLSIKLYTGNMVDCQLPEYKWSLSDFQKLRWSSTHSAATTPQQVPEKGDSLRWATTGTQGFKCASPGWESSIVQCLLRNSPELHLGAFPSCTLFLNKSLVQSFKAHRPSPERGFSSCPAGSMLCSLVQGVKTRAKCKHKPNPFQPPTCFNLLLIAATLNLQMSLAQKKEMGIFFFVYIYFKQPNLCVFYT